MCASWLLPLDMPLLVSLEDTEKRALSRRRFCLLLLPALPLSH